MASVVIKQVGMHVILAFQVFLEILRHLTSHISQGLTAATIHL